MSNNLKYITFDQLMSSVEADLHSFADAGMIDRGKVIKVVMKVNEDIGLKINAEKEALLDVVNHKADLPADFYRLNVAFACGLTVGHAHKHAGEQFGTVTQELDCSLDLGVQYVANPTSPLPNAVNECGAKFWVAQRFTDRVERFTDLTPVRIRQSGLRFCHKDSPNIHTQSKYDVDFDEEQIITGFECGKLYINYTALMADLDNNLLILDHPLTTEYYEYAVKKHLLENFMLNNDADVAQKLKYINEMLRDARIRAISFVNTPEYSQIREMYQANRRRFYDRYMEPFRPSSNNSWDNNLNSLWLPYA